MRRYISTNIYDYILENQNIKNKIKAYRGIGNQINSTYGGVSDDGIGIFWTDNIIMAKWFAGLIEYNGNIGRYEKVSNDGKIIQKLLTFDNPYIINSKDQDYDSFQTYMDEIDNFGGVEKYKTYLIQNNYDGIILKNNNTNYYDDGVYDIYIEF